MSEVSFLRGVNLTDSVVDNDAEMAIMLNGRFRHFFSVNDGYLIPGFNRWNDRRSSYVLELFDDSLSPFYLTTPQGQIYIFNSNDGLECIFRPVSGIGIPYGSDWSWFWYGKAGTSANSAAASIAGNNGGQLTLRCRDGNTANLWDGNTSILSVEITSADPRTFLAASYKHATKEFTLRANNSDDPDSYKTIVYNDWVQATTDLWFGATYDPVIYSANTPAGIQSPARNLQFEKFMSSNRSMEDSMLEHDQVVQYLIDKCGATIPAP